LLWFDALTLVNHTYVTRDHTVLLATHTAVMRHRSLAGTYCAYPRRDGQTELTWLFVSKALRYCSCVARKSHSFTCHPHTNHTCLYSPAARHHRPLAGTHCVYSRRDGQAELTWVAGHTPR